MLFYVFLLLPCVLPRFPCVRLNFLNFRRISLSLCLSQTCSVSSWMCFLAEPPCELLCVIFLNLTCPSPTTQSCRVPVSKVRQMLFPTCSTLSKVCSRVSSNFPYISFLWPCPDCCRVPVPLSRACSCCPQCVPCRRTLNRVGTKCVLHFVFPPNWLVPTWRADLVGFVKLCQIPVVPNVFLLVDLLFPVSTNCLMCATFVKFIVLVKTPSSVHV